MRHAVPVGTSRQADFFPQCPMVTNTELDIIHVGSNDMDNTKYRSDSVNICVEQTARVMDFLPRGFLSSLNKNIATYNSIIEKSYLDHKLIYIRHRLLSEKYKRNGIYPRHDAGVRLIVEDVKRTLRHYEKTWMPWTRAAAQGAAAVYSPFRMHLLYVTYIRPVTEYAAPVWHSGLSTLLCNKLEKVQRRALRIILGKDFISYSKACEQLALPTLKGRREELAVKFARVADQREIFKTNSVVVTTRARAVPMQNGLMTLSIPVAYTQEKIPASKKPTVTPMEALLPANLAHSLKWNSFINTAGGKWGNMPLDLRLEQNTLLKAFLEHLGPNLN
ncbi:hypothetical protein Bbelb_291830 [Branchiostoma belcheri]|nr:hypothetical protein Bbelb_291830 [Branchiostoma belcheri]